MICENNWRNSAPANNITGCHRAVQGVIGGQEGASWDQMQTLPGKSSAYDLPLGDVIEGAGLHGSFLLQFPNDLQLHTAPCTCGRVYCQRGYPSKQLPGIMPLE